MQRTAYATRHKASRVRAALKAARAARTRRGARGSLLSVPAAALLAALATGCTSDPGAAGTDVDAKIGESTGTVAPPGKYRTLLEPCGSVGRSTLGELLPGAAELPEDQRQKILRGEPASTFDTDRRAGCSWKAAGAGASHTLSLDFERVVSYDAAVSDNDRAQEVFIRKQVAALPDSAVPSSRSSQPPQGSADDRNDDRNDDRSDDRSDSQGADQSSDQSGDESGGQSEPTEGLESRVLDDLGDAAFLSDVPTPAGGGSTAQRRTVSVAFRTSNVIVTVVYTEQSSSTTAVPDSEELQDKAQSLAQSLAGEFSE
ncbi:hypothetical protein [Streptomyces katsurahamanus]|uniref:DUF3558 domain-containing protein n=1 Tax=Streptomyces katsurahamanus TaxID=2577098 RepID=A0ABW9NPI4_9ACTN|nr:hypothetical protein [Streptomyces katsurahamanus]MQS35054.1 hypothetical protein [Streptomyces katsurahamanus]